MRLDLLAIAAHPDDVELTCGGTLLKAAEQGYKTGILDLTAGEMGTRGTSKTRLKEAAVAGRILRVTHRENLGLPDAHLEVNEKYKMALARRIRAEWPHVRFVLSSGSVSVSELEARRLGADAVLAKPYRPEDLRRTLLSYAAPQWTRIAS